MDVPTKNAITKDKRNEVILAGAGILAKALGVVVPAAGATAGIVVDAIKQRRSDRHYARLMLLLEHLGRRMAALEHDNDQEPVELIDEIIAQAVSDEDEEKMQYYAGLIDYAMAAKPNPYLVRILGNALRQMTRLDIDAFLFFSKRNTLPPDLPNMLKDSFWNRIEPLGIFKGGSMKHSNNLTQFGKELLHVCVVPGDDGRPDDDE